MYLQINGSLARRAIKDLVERGLVRVVSIHSSQQIFTRATNT
jgi:small subunit ribosomal protein S25e